jgi:ZIP family zinc transporter
VMLSASFFSLIMPGLAQGELIYQSKVMSAGIAAASIMIGVGFIAFLNETVPHQHFAQGLQGPPGLAMPKVDVCCRGATGDAVSMTFVLRNKRR